MSVVVDGQAEVPFVGLARLLEHVVARTQELHDRERQVGVAQRVAGALPLQEIGERGRARLEGEVVPELAGQLHDPCPALGDAHDPADPR